MKKMTKKQWENDVVVFLMKNKEDPTAKHLLESFAELEKSRLKKRENKIKVEARKKITGDETVAVKKKDLETARNLLAEVLLYI